MEVEQQGSNWNGRKSLKELQGSRISSWDFGNWLSIEETTPHPRLIGSHWCYDIWCQMRIKTELSKVEIYKEIVTQKLNLQGSIPNFLFNSKNHWFFFLHWCLSWNWPWALPFTWCNNSWLNVEIHNSITNWSINYWCMDSRVGPALSCLVLEGPLVIDQYLFITRAL